MKVIKVNRDFTVGLRKNIKINHIANMHLRSNEQITFISKKNREYDFVKKNWGYYATPSINGRLKIFKFRCCLVESQLKKKKFIFVVYKEKTKQLKKYLKNEKLNILFWI